MYYELYIDSLFFANLIMNFFLLSLTNKIRGRSATCLRRIAGAAYGAGIYCVVFFIPIYSLLGRLILGFFISTFGMVWLTFRCKTFSQVLVMIPSMAGAMFFLGGFYFFMKERYVFRFEIIEGLIGLVVIGGIAYGVGGFLVKRTRHENTSFCQVVLQGEKEKLKVKALIDTGNSLVEPLSKKPVSILDQRSLETLFDGCLPQYYRVVPYTSIGKKNGILKCFEIPRIWVEYQENEKIYEKVLVACSEELSSVKECYMILNPRLIQNQEEKEYDI